MEDVDGDGEWEQVIEIRRPNGHLERWEIEKDGTIHLILYYSDGKVKNEWMEYPDPENPDGYTIYVWDEETEQWLLDQNRNGAPNKDEQ